MDAFTPQQTTELVSRIGTKKAYTRLDKIFFNSVLAGPLLGFGCAVAVTVNGSPWFSADADAPGLLRLLACALFPIGLVMIVLSGADLYTSNVMFMGLAWLHRRVGIIDVIKVSVVSFLGNLAGSLFFTIVIIGYGGVLGTPDFKAAAISLAVSKAVTPAWYQVMLRAIGANWLVCFAVFISISGREIVSKIIAVWWPTAAFVCLGLDHVIANMFFIPLGIFYGAPGITVGYYIWKSMIPAFIGNTIGGFVMLALPFWYLYLTGEGSVKIHFDQMNAADTAVQDQGGLTARRLTNTKRNFWGRRTEPAQEMEKNAMSATSSSPRGTSLVIDGHEPHVDETSGEEALPDSSSKMESGLALELNAEQYGKPKTTGRIPSVV